MVTIRQSNMELLRLVCMFMVMVCHANGYINEGDLIGVDGVIRLIINQFCLICVNCFVMVSGWFGIKASWKGAAKLLFQVIFVAVLCFAIFAVFGQPVSFQNDLLPYLAFGYGYWFVISYLVLYALSPVLEAFVNNVSESDFRKVLYFIFAAEMVFSYVLGEGSYGFGFSPLAFISIYLLARYARMYPGKLFALDKKYDLLIYVLATVLSIIGLWFGYQLFGMGFHLNHYDSPLAIIASLYFLLFFSKLRIESKTVNWLAASAFAIYLFHENSLVSPYYHQFFSWLKETVTIVEFYPLMFVLLILFGLAFLLIDKSRIFLWKRISQS